MVNHDGKHRVRYVSHEFPWLSPLCTIACLALLPFMCWFRVRKNRQTILLDYPHSLADIGPHSQLLNSINHCYLLYPIVGLCFTVTIYPRCGMTSLDDASVSEGGVSPLNHQEIMWRNRDPGVQHAISTLLRLSSLNY